MLKIESLSKSFAQPDGDVRVLVNADWELGPRQTAALLGESGSGKSTLLNLVAGLDVPDSGEIYLDGERTSGFTESRWNVFRRNDLGLVFQHYHLVPTLPVDDNIHLQARLAGRVDSAFSRQLIEHLGLGALLKRLPHQLSGGQQQRVAIARSLMHRPWLVLADEPTGNLDEHTSVMVMKLFTELIRESDSSLLMVTHSETMAAFLDSRWRLHNGEILAES